MIDIVNIEQPGYRLKVNENLTLHTFGSRESWLHHRTGIGGSDAAAIVGMNPYKTNEELWLEKIGHVQPDDISDKPYVRYGTEAEPHLRALFALDHPELEVFYEENNMFLNRKYPFAHASLDGWTMEKVKECGNRQGILEIKTTNILQSMQKEKWNDRIPDNYYIQCLWYMGVTEFDYCDLKAQLKYEYGGSPVIHTREYHIERYEVEEDIQYLFHKAAEFWTAVKTGKRPSLVLPGI